MKTAVLSWCLFNIAFALPIPYGTSSHANALKKSKIEQDSLSDLNYDTKKHKDPASSAAPGLASPTENSLSDLNYDTKKHKDPAISAALLIASPTEALLDSSAQMVPSYRQDFLLDMSDDPSDQKQSLSRSDFDYSSEEEITEFSDDFSQNEFSVDFSQNELLDDFSRNELLDDFSHNDFLNMPMDAEDPNLEME